MPGRVLGRGQRAVTYIVISKPKRRSVAVGGCHCMSCLLEQWRSAEWRLREPVCSNWNDAGPPGSRPGLKS